MHSAGQTQTEIDSISTDRTEIKLKLN